MAIKRSASAQWSGTGKEGKGSISSASGVLSNTPYSYLSRFENEANTNPEELIAAAHASCFSMKLAFNLVGAGFEAKDLQTTCEIVFEDGSITASNLTLKAQVDGIDAEKFEELVQHAKANCPISKLLNTNITLDYKLN